MAKFNLFQFLQEVRSEGQKTTWPTRRETLITTGPFAFVRHPLYAADIFALPGLVAVWSNDLWFVSVWLFMLAVLPLFTRREERFMEQHFGEAYRRYREQVPAFIPWRGRVRV